MYVKLFLTLTETPRKNYHKFTVSLRICFESFSTVQCIRSFFQIYLLRGYLSSCTKISPIHPNIHWNCRSGKKTAVSI